MTEKLAGLVIPVLDPLGYQQGWGTATVARIRKEIPEDVGRLTLRQENITEVLTCGGLWQGREIATEIPAHVFILRRDLFVRVAREYLEAAVIDEAPKPIEFVHNFLGTEANFDPLTATWLSWQSRYEREWLEMAIAGTLSTPPYVRCARDAVSAPDPPLEIPLLTPRNPLFCAGLPSERPCPYHFKVLRAA